MIFWDYFCADLLKKCHSIYQTNNGKSFQVFLFITSLDESQVFDDVLCDLLVSAEVIVNYLASHVLLVYNESRQREIIQVYDSLSQNLPQDQRREYSFNSTIPDDQCEMLYNYGMVNKAVPDLFFFNTADAGFGMTNPA